jgi:GT2 family glycosyltransferase
MILSVIIVNFNVKYFLEQCLSTVKRAIDQSSFLSGMTEVYIVDNASGDESLPFLQPLFPGFHFISNTENAGFARGTNLVLPQCSGEYILFLNPDTLLAEDTLDLCVSFFRSHADAGAVGVRMIDGQGVFLKESKRGFPDPRSSFFKMNGLAALFPSSRLFAAYYAGHLDSHSQHPVEILSGAFMMVRKSALEKTGGFDEQFFMYAEDIDLSYRIEKAGFQNYYLGTAAVIHFKGESTPRDIRYVKQFYLAMNQFLKKHFRDSSSSLLIRLLTWGVSIRRHLATVALNFQKKPGALKPGAFFTKGEPDELPAIKQALQRAGILLTNQQTAAAGELFCVNDRLSMKSVIQEMDKAPRRFSYFMHIAGTHAIVGVPAGASQGEIILL